MMTNEEREDMNTFKHDLVKQARWWQWKAETLEKEKEQLKAENADLHEKLKETEHRVEVVERAFDNTMEVFHEILSAIFPDKKIDLDKWKKDNLANAEKELAEERKDE